MSQIDEIMDRYIGEAKRKKSAEPRKTPFNKLTPEEQEVIKAEKTKEDQLDLDAYVKKFGIKVSNRIPNVSYSGYSAHLTKKDKKKLKMGDSIEDEMVYWEDLAKTLLYHKKRLSVGNVSPIKLKYDKKYLTAKGALSDVKSKIASLKDRIKKGK